MSEPKADRPPYRSLATAKLAVMKAVDAVLLTPDPAGAHVAEADLFAALRPAMVKAGLSVAPASARLVHAGSYTDSLGDAVNRVAVEVRFVLSHVGGETQDLCVVAEAADAGDRACERAASDALKRALRQAFLIDGAEAAPAAGRASKADELYAAMAAALSEAATPHRLTQIRDGFWRKDRTADAILRFNRLWAERLAALGYEEKIVPLPSKPAPAGATASPR